jgi:hypothetical protein
MSTIQRPEIPGFAKGDQLKAADLQTLSHAVASLLRSSSPALHHPLNLRVAVIGSLAAPTSAATDPTQCTCAVLLFDPSTEKLTPTARRIIAHNFSAGLTAQDGTYGKVEWDGVWEIYWCDCRPTPEFVGLEA